MHMKSKASVVNYIYRYYGQFNDDILKNWLTTVIIIIIYN